MEGEAQQIEPGAGARHLLKFVDRIELHQRRVVLDAVVGQGGLDEERAREIVQRLEPLPALDLLLELLVAEVLGLAFERADAVDLLIGREQLVQCPGDLGRHGFLEQRGDAGAFVRHHPADHVLQGRVLRRDDVLVG